MICDLCKKNESTKMCDNCGRLVCDACMGDEYCTDCEILMKVGMTSGSG